MRNSWFRFNAVELTIGCAAEAGASFGLVYYALLLYFSRPADSVLFAGFLLLSVLSAACLIGTAAAFRLYAGGAKLFAVSTVALLLIYAFWPGLEEQVSDTAFWLHMSLLPLNLCMYGLPKVRHLLSYTPDENQNSAGRYFEVPPVPVRLPWIAAGLPPGIGLGIFYYFL